jgi:dUTP pyrophosphatase
MPNVNIKLLNDSARLPTKGTPGAAAFDLYSTEEVFIPPGKTVAIRTGLVMEIPEGWKGEIYSRSGMAYSGIVVANSPGKIDSDYRGEIKVLLQNISNCLASIQLGDRIAQFEVNPVSQLNFIQVEGIHKATERGDGGFGSTGK